MEIVIPKLREIPTWDWMKTDFTIKSLASECDILLSNHVWVTARKEEIPVRQMSTFHIQNCINCFNGEGRQHISKNYLGGRDKWLQIFNDELNSRN